MAAPVGSIADRVAAARRRCLVGRQPELRAFEHALEGAVPAVAALWFHEPGGVGKSTLLEPPTSLLRPGVVLRVLQPAATR